VRQDAVWVLTASWWDGDSLRTGHEFFSTKRDAEAVGKTLKDRHNTPDNEFYVLVEQARPWASSTREIPFSTPPTIEQMTETTERIWGL
jgi:hypothetical protein